MGYFSRFYHLYVKRRTLQKQNSFFGSFTLNTKTFSVWNSSLFSWTRAGIEQRHRDLFLWPWCDYRWRFNSKFVGSEPTEPLDQFWRIFVVVSVSLLPFLFLRLSTLSGFYDNCRQPLPEDEVHGLHPSVSSAYRWGPYFGVVYKRVDAHGHHGTRGGAFHQPGHREVTRVDHTQSYLIQNHN